MFNFLDSHSQSTHTQTQRHTYTCDSLRAHKHTHSRRKLWFYSGGGGAFFESRLGHRLFGLKFSWLFSVSPDKYQDSILKKATIAFIHINSNPLLTILPFDAMESELLTLSLKSYKRSRYRDWLRGWTTEGSEFKPH
jgi:hypothetical protein